MVSFLAGRRFSAQGDSITAFGNGYSVQPSGWQDVVVQRTGMTQVSQDALAGRTFATALACWGNPAPGAAPGAFNASYVLTGTTTCGGLMYGFTNGMSFAQSLANVDLEIISLGTNDHVEPIGTLGDATNSGTFYGNMRWVVEAYLNAKPTLRVVMVTPQFNAIVAPAVTQQYAEAMVAYGNSIGIPVINMFEKGGLNAITAGALTADGTHPNIFGYENFYGPVIANGIISLF
jgi:hypothetical protein